MIMMRLDGGPPLPGVRGLCRRLRFGSKLGTISAGQKSGKPAFIEYLINLVVEAFGTGNIPAILEQLSNEVRWEDWADNFAQKAGVPWAAKQHGKAGVMEFFKTIGSSFNIKGFHVLSIMAGENQVAVEFTMEVEIPSTGGYFLDEEMHLWTFDPDGKVIRLRHYLDTAKHIKAAGL